VARSLLRPFGYLAFLTGLLALSATARLLGEQDELGFFSGRLARAVWRYPEVTRGGVRMAWLLWALAFALAISPYDPLTTRWDEVALGVGALIVLARHFYAARRAGH
jgi:hypothetical protein